MTNINLAQYYVRKAEFDSLVDTEIESYLEDIISQASDYSYILDLVYPIGSIYMSVNNVSPSTLFGGTWESMGEGRTLIGAGTNDGTTYTAGSTGGEKTHTLTTNEMPSHTHGNVWWNLIVSADGNTGRWSLNNGSLVIETQADRDASTRVTGNTGSGWAHNNMQPYLVVYMWKRTG